MKFFFGINLYLKPWSRMGLKPFCISAVVFILLRVRCCQVCCMVRRRTLNIRAFFSQRGRCND